MVKLCIGIEEGKDTPFFELEGNIGTEESLYIEITHYDVEGSIPAKIIRPLKDLLKLGIHLEKIHLSLGEPRRESAQDLLYCCLLGVLSYFPSTVHSLIIECEDGDACLDEPVILEFLKNVLLDPKNSLTYLQLTRFKFTEDSSLNILGEMLSHPACPLKGFNLSECSTPNLGPWIKSYLGKTRLTLLGLNYIQPGFDDDAAIELGAVLKNHPTLKFLDIGYLNDVYDKGAKAIAEALKTNTVLEYLDFTNNHLEEEALVEFAKALEINQTLVVLSMPFQEDGETDDRLHQSAIAFGKAFKVNHTLAYFNLDGSTPTEEGDTALEEGLRENQALQVFTIDSYRSSEFENILKNKKQMRKKCDLLWLIWEEFGGFRPGQSVAGGVFAGCDFSADHFTNATGNKSTDIGSNSLTISAFHKIAKIVGCFDTAIPKNDSSSPSNTEYSSYFQWLPKEMVEDTLVLPLSKAAITAEQQRINQRRVPDGFWTQVQEVQRCAKRRKIEGEKKEIDDAASLQLN